LGHANEKEVTLNKKMILALRRGGYAIVPILPQHDLYLTVFPPVVRELTALHRRCGEPADRVRKPGERFAAIFRAAWERIPLTARRAILCHWRGFGEPICVGLTDFPKESEFSGACIIGGSVLLFSLIHDLLRKPPHLKSADTIAYELAQVYRYATIDLLRLEEESVETRKNETIVIGWCPLRVAS
jgi:hypothetical protein